MKFYVVGKEILGKGFAAVTDGKEVSIVEAKSTKEAVSNAIKTILEGYVTTNEQGLAPQMTNIYAVDTIGKVISNNAVGDWLRTGKTSKGNPLKQEELVAVRDAYIALTARSFNARIIPIGDLKQADLANKSMVQQAWAGLDRHIATLQPAPALGLGGLGMGLGTTPVQPQVTPAANAGGMDMNAMMAQMQQMQQMMAMMAQMQTTQQVAPAMPVAPIAPVAPVEQPVLGTPAAGDMNSLTSLGSPTALNVDLTATQEPATDKQEAPVVIAAE